MKAAQGAYTSETLPMHWIAIDSAGLPWLVDTQPGGWQRRRAYHGHTVGLRVCAQGVAIGLCLASGAPSAMFAQANEAQEA